MNERDLEKKIVEKVELTIWYWEDAANINEAGFWHTGI